MWNFRKNKKPKLKRELQEWIQYTLLWQIENFSHFDICKVKIYNEINFYSDIQFVDSENLAEQILFKLAEILNISTSIIQFETFTTQINEIGSIFLEHETEIDDASFTEKRQNKFIIGLNESVMDNMNFVVLTLLFELIFVKLTLLNENDFDPECKEVIAIGLGFGAFSLNQNFNYYQNEKGWGYTKLGNLSLDEIVYTIGLFSYLRNEKKPLWLLDYNNYNSEIQSIIDYFFDNENEAMIISKLIEIKNKNSI